MTHSSDSSDDNSNNDSTIIPLRDTNGELIWPLELACGIDILERAAMVQTARYFEAQRREGGEDFILPQGVPEETNRLRDAFSARHPDAIAHPNLDDLILLGLTGQAMQNVAARTQQSSSSKQAAPAQATPQLDERTQKRFGALAKIGRKIAAEQSAISNNFRARYPDVLDPHGYISLGEAAVKVYKQHLAKAAPPAPLTQPANYYNSYAAYPLADIRAYNSFPLMFAPTPSYPVNVPAAALTAQNLSIHNSRALHNAPPPQTNPYLSHMRQPTGTFEGVPEADRRAYESLSGKYGLLQTAGDDISALSERDQYVATSRQQASKPSYHQQVSAHIGEKRNMLATGASGDKAKAVKAIIRGKEMALSAQNETESAPSIAPKAHAAPAHHYSTRAQGTVPEQPWVGERSTKKPRLNPGTVVDNAEQAQAVPGVRPLPAPDGSNSSRSNSPNR